jgi:DNA-binding NarL/FixJ family response regulator
MAFAPPKGLRGAELEIDGEPYAVLVYPLVGTTAVPAELTKAEAAIAKLVARGLSNEEISSSRGSSPCTVANQLQAIYRKLLIGYRTQLVRVMGRAR